MNIINLIKQKLIKTPWDKFYTKEDLKVKVPDTSMYEVLKEAVLKYESRPIINYFGKRITYREFSNNVDKAALAFRSQGVRRGDIVTICMPNTPEAMISFYALNKIGAICNMIHPLSGEVEIKEYLLSTNSVMLVMIDLCYEKVKNIRKYDINGWTTKKSDDELKAIINKLKDISNIIKQECDKYNFTFIDTSNNFEYVINNISL